MVFLDTVVAVYINTQFPYSADHAVMNSAPHGEDLQESCFGWRGANEYPAV